MKAPPSEVFSLSGINATVTYLMSCFMNQNLSSLLSESRNRVQTEGSETLVLVVFYLFDGPLYVIIVIGLYEKVKRGAVYFLKINLFIDY